MDQRSDDAMSRNSYLGPSRVQLIREVSRCSFSRLRERGDPPIRLLASALLLVAAGLKYLQVATTPLMSNDSEWLRWGQIASIELEILWGVWLLAGTCSRFTRLASALLFTFFAAYSAYRGAWGYESCGCFGVIPVAPWLMFVLDSLLAVAFFFLPSKPELRDAKTSFWSRRLAVVLGVWALLALPIGLFSSGPKGATISEDGEIVGSEDIVLLDPRQWTGKRFPLMRHLDAGATFTRGRWRLLFVRPGCPYCVDALRQLLSAVPLGASDGEARWGLIALPPLPANAPSAFLPPHAGVPMGRLDAEKNWIANVPFTITIHDGIVVEWLPGFPQQT